MRTNVTNLSTDSSVNRKQNKKHGRNRPAQYQKKNKRHKNQTRPYGNPFELYNIWEAWRHVLHTTPTMDRIIAPSFY